MKTVMTADEIRKLLPHRWPFLFLDRVLELHPGVSGVGLKNVTMTEHYFEGHFPTESVMPGVLIIEALAQMTAIVYSTGIVKSKQETNGLSATVIPENGNQSDLSAPIGYLVAINDMKFMKPVVPGDQLLLKVEIGRSLGTMSKAKVAAYVNKECVVRGTLTVSQRPE